MDFPGYDPLLWLARFSLSILVGWGAFEAGRLIQQERTRREHKALCETILFLRKRLDELHFENQELKKATQKQVWN